MQVWSPEQARRGEPQARLAKETALPWEQVQPAALQEEPLRAAVPAAWEPDAPRAVPEAAVSARAVAALRPEAAMAASELQAEAAAAGAPDEPRAVVAAEAASDVTVRRPVAARREDAEVQPRAAVQPDVQVLPAVVQPAEAARPGGQRAAVPWALPSAAASVFRQGPSLAAGPARPPAAARFARAMRSLPIASRSEPSSQAARNEDWS